MVAKRFEDLECWKSARVLAKSIFLLTRADPFKKDFGHRDQINNSAGSTMDNIAEGFGRRGNKEFLYFLHVALGSSYEVRSQLIRAKDKDYLNEEEFQINSKLADSTSALVYKLIITIRNSDFKGPKFK